ncbi:hypothetical protein [Dyella thiooxydans]|uniref:hypothetical protein n=1 Tax=Dyella thiooxydans TaxID=445710 RepID=UPI0012F8161E|nr:hypothetical protein [Dyella thiooxydans]
MHFAERAPHRCALSRALAGIWLLLVLLLAAPPAAFAAPPENVYFAGVAFSANAAGVPKEFPHLSRVLDSATNAQVNSALRQRIRENPSAPKLIFDQLGSIKDSSRSTALALALDGESTSIERIGDVFKSRLEISAQLLFFDFKEKQILGGFPIIVDYIDTSSQPPDDNDIDRQFRAMVLGEDGRHSLLDEFVSALASASVPTPASRHLRVTSVTLGPKALSYLHQAMPNADPEVVRGQIAREFGKYLSANQRLAILPYASSQALGGSMAARFIEGDAYQLKIPEADYAISLKVAGFKKIEQGRTDTSIGYIYGAFVDVAVTEPMSGTVYFSQSIKQGASQTVPVTQSAMDDWANAYDTLRLLFNNFTLAISNPDSRWVTSSMPHETGVKSQLNSLKGLVQSCR